MSGSRLSGVLGQARPVGPAMRACTDERLLRPALAPCVAVSRCHPCRTLCLVERTGGSDLGNGLLRRSCRSFIARGYLQNRHDKARDVLNHSDRNIRRPGGKRGLVLRPAGTQLRWNWCAE
jgi:hypothetical protein